MRPEPVVGTEKPPGCEPHTRTGNLVAPILRALTLASCASTPPERIEAGRLGQVVLFRPVRAPAGMVLLLSDETGWSVPGHGWR